MSEAKGPMRAAFELLVDHDFVTSNERAICRMDRLARIVFRKNCQRIGTVNERLSGPTLARVAYDAAEAMELERTKRLNGEWE